MSDKHTPGPWRTGSLVSYNAGTGEPEAFVYRLDPEDQRETAHNRICVRGADGAMDCDADARLIAAAPSLAAALRAAVVDIRLVHNNQAERYLVATQAIGKIEAALKAAGVEQ